MKNTILKSILGAGLLFSVTSCSDFGDMNVSPNSPANPNTASLLTGVSVSYTHLDVYKRQGLEFTVYQNNNKDQIIPLAVAPTSGYSNAIINAGLIRTKGLEIHINAVPVSYTHLFPHQKKR